MTAARRSRVAGMVLAAGAGSRMGMAKALLPWGIGTLLDRAVATVERGGCEAVYAVLGADAARVREAAPAGCRLVHNPDWTTGMGSSLRAGLAALPLWCEAVVVVLVDQPGITAEAVARLIHAHRAADARAVAMAGYHGRRGHPVLFDRSVWTQVAAWAHGDAGARHFLAAHPESITEVDCTGLADPGDVDTPAQLAAARNRLLG